MKFYKNLLEKYIKHVIEWESTDFLSEDYKTDRFTEMEWVELQTLRTSLAPSKEPLVRSEEYTKDIKDLLAKELITIGTIA